MKIKSALMLLLILLSLPAWTGAQDAPESDEATSGKLLERYPIILMVREPGAPESRQVSAYLEVWLSGQRRVYGVDYQENTYGAAEAFLHQLIEAGGPPTAEQMTALLIGEATAAAYP